MPGFVVQMGSTVICAHAGQAQPTMPNPRVLLGGQPAVTLSSPWVVAGCAQAAISSPPCVTGQFLMGATRVIVGGAPVLIQGGQSVCSPNGTPLQILVTQVRVKAT